MVILYIYSTCWCTKLVFYECQYKPNLDFIQALNLHSEVLLKHCSYHSDTRGVTALPPNRNLNPTFGRRNGSNKENE
jgi:hypothetical protein